jgi:hypothetical protein
VLLELVTWLVSYKWFVVVEAVRKTNLLIQIFFGCDSVFAVDMTPSMLMLSVRLYRRRKLYSV